MAEIVDTLELAAAFVALPCWEWLPGMLDINGRRVLIAHDGVPGAWTVSYDGAPPRIVESLDRPWRLSLWADAAPDLNDDATRGCILGLARKAWRNPGLSVRACPPYNPTEWMVHGAGSRFEPKNKVAKTGLTEAAALYAALANAPTWEPS